MVRFEPARLVGPRPVAVVGSAQSLGDPAFRSGRAVRCTGRASRKGFGASRRTRRRLRPRAAARAKPRVNRSDYYYVKLHIAHLVQLIEMNDPVAFMLFGMLLGESFANRGKPFELPTRGLLRIPGLTNVTRLRAQLRKLEQCGLDLDRLPEPRGPC